jgi:hypothetical protein
LAPGGLDFNKVVLAHPNRKKKTMVRAINFFMVHLRKLKIEFEKNHQHLARSLELRAATVEATV